MARPGGRPPQDPDGLRLIRITIRLTAAEAAELARRAVECGQPPGVHMRLAFFALEPPRPVPAINRTAWTELSRLAGNLNQLAHHANSGEGVVVPLEQVLETMRLVRFLREDLRRDE